MWSQIFGPHYIFLRQHTTTIRNTESTTRKQYFPLTKMRNPDSEKCVRWQPRIPQDLLSKENDTFLSFVFESRAASHTSNTAPDSLTPPSSKLHKAKQGKKHLCELTAWNPTRRWQLRPKGHIDVYINRSMHNKYWELGWDQYPSSNLKGPARLISHEATAPDRDSLCLHLSWDALPHVRSPR